MDSTGCILIRLECRNNCLFCNQTPFKVLQRILPRYINLKKEEREILKDAITLKKRGIKKVKISGQDPIQYKKLPELITWLKKNGFLYVEVTTHGRDLCNKELVTKLEKAGLDGIRIPVYGSTPVIHDGITRAKGSFNETLKGLDNLKENAPHIKIILSTLILKQNFRDLFNIIKLISKYSEDIFICLPYLKKGIYHERFAPNLLKIREELKRILRLKEENRMNIFFSDIPYCIFGVYKDYILNNVDLSLGRENRLYPVRYCVRREKNVLEYRVKKKLRKCDNCNYNEECSGFLAEDIKQLDEHKINIL